MICPHCGKEAIVPDNVLLNVDIYGQQQRSVTGCCMRGVWVIPTRTYRLEKDQSGATRDNWGRPLRVGE